MFAVTCCSLSEDSETFSSREQSHVSDLIFVMDEITDEERSERGGEHAAGARGRTDVVPGSDDSDNSEKDTGMLHIPTLSEHIHAHSHPT